VADKFTFIDLFAGIGGFHAALTGLGGRCVYVAEKDRYAKEVYRKAWLPEDGGAHFTSDINDDVPVDTGHTIAELLERAQASEIVLENIPQGFDVLTAGFPCQTFSKSGKQAGILDKVRGTLFYNILVIVAMRRPKVVFVSSRDDIQDDCRCARWPRVCGEPGPDGLLSALDRAGAWRWTAEPGTRIHSCCSRRPGFQQFTLHRPNPLCGMVN
jgi:hypothetical protein